MSLLEQDTTRKGREFSVLEFEPNNNDKEYMVEAIQDSAIYTKEADRHLPGLYYLVAWKGYLEEENIWESFLAVMQLWKMFSTFHKDHPKKPTATSAPLDSAPPMAKPRVKPTKLLKRKRGQLAKKRATKRATWDDKEESESV